MGTWRPRWVAVGELAVSPMPTPETLEGLAGFRAVYSLATPSEYMFRGVDPRLEAGLVERFVWRPTGEYNAPPLPSLARDIASLAAKPVLVHCSRGCGRSSMAAAAWLMRHRGEKLPAALASVVEGTGCGIETMPQQTVLQAYTTALAAGLEDWVKAADTGDPFPEYLLVLAYKLSWLSPGEKCPGEEARRARGDPGHPLARLAGLLARSLGYTLAGVDVRGGKPGGVRVVFTVWIPRGAHPAAIPSPVKPPRGLEEEAARLLASYSDAEKVEVVLRVHRPGEPPWL